LVHGLAETPARTTERRVATTRAACGNRFAGHRLVEARQQLSRFFLHRGPEHRSEFIDLPLDTLRLEDRCG